MTSLFGNDKRDFNLKKGLYFLNTPVSYLVKLRFLRTSFLICKKRLQLDFFQNESTHCKYLLIKVLNNWEKKEEGGRLLLSGIGHV